jgi:hypothetical protein
MLHVGSEYTEPVLQKVALVCLHVIVVPCLPVLPPKAPGLRQTQTRRQQLAAWLLVVAASFEAAT